MYAMHLMFNIVQQVQLRIVRSFSVLYYQTGQELIHSAVFHIKKPFMLAICKQQVTAFR